MLNKLNKRQRITLLVVLFLLIVIPVIIFLVRQQQILRGRAQVDQRLVFVNSTGTQLPGDPPTTNTRDVTVKVTHSSAGTPPPPTGGNPPPPVSVTPPPPTSVPVFPPPDQSKRRVFVSSVKYDGNLGGLAGADAKCQDLANRVGETGLGGTWKAWLSGAVKEEPAISRLNPFNGSYYLVNNQTKVADNFNDFIAQSGELFNVIQSPINMTEAGVILPLPTGTQGAVWTNTFPSGFSVTGENIVNGNLIDPACKDWTANTGFITGSIGDYSSKDMGWTLSFISINCAQQARLYCFEQ